MSGMSEGVNCRNCGRANDPRARFCQHCGYDMILGDSVPEGKHLTPMPIIGGFLMIVATVLTLWGVSIGLNTDAFYWGYYYIVSFVDLPDLFLYIHAILAIVGFVGGISALMREHLGIAFIGGLCGAIGLGFGVGIAGLLFILASADEFKSRGFLGEVTSAPFTGHVPDFPATYGRRI